MLEILMGVGVSMVVFTVVGVGRESPILGVAVASVGAISQCDLVIGCGVFYACMYVVGLMQETANYALEGIRG